VKIPFLGKQSDHPKLSYPNLTLHGVTTRYTSTRICNWRFKTETYRALSFGSNQSRSSNLFFFLLKMVHHTKVLFMV